LLEAGQALDIEMEKITRKRMFITHHGRPRMQIAPAALGLRCGREERSRNPTAPSL
jgi:hypothetical protein